MVAENRDDASALSGSAVRLAPGLLIAGRYRLEAKLGEGGMGEVWAATHAITRRSVAMKFLKGASAPGSELHQRFFREARAASLVRHPNVVEVLDVFELDDGMPVMVMDRLIGETLGAKLAREKQLPVEEVVALLLPSVDAVAAAHQRGIVHRDLKPDNVFLEAREGGQTVVKVLDFGIAKLTAHDGDAAASGALTESGSMLGTPWYMAPEQLYADTNIDARADVWGLGVILYECLAGRRPLEGANMGQMLHRLHHEGIVPIEERVPDVPPPLARMVARMLARDRAERMPDLTEARAILASMSGAPSTPPLTPLTPSKPAGSSPPRSAEQALELALGETQQATTPWGSDAPSAGPRPARTASRRTAARIVAAVAVIGTLGLIGWSWGKVTSTPSMETAPESSPSRSAPAPSAALAPTPMAAPLAGLAALGQVPSVTSLAPAASSPLPQLSPPSPSASVARKSAKPSSAEASPPAKAAQPAASAVAAPARRKTDGGLFEAVPF